MVWLSLNQKVTTNSEKNVFLSERILRKPKKRPSKFIRCYRIHLNSHLFQLSSEVWWHLTKVHWPNDLFAFIKVTIPNNINHFTCVEFIYSFFGNVSYFRTKSYNSKTLLLCLYLKFRYYWSMNLKEALQLLFTLKNFQEFSD